MHLHHRYYALIRQSDQLFPISPCPGLYGESLSFKGNPDCPSDLPQFTLRFLIYMPPSIPRQPAPLHLSVSSRSVSAFAQHVEARHLHLCPRHLPLVSQRTAFFTRLQCSLYATACRIVRPTEMAPSAFARVWGFYFRAFPYLVTRIRVGYSYLGEQTIPRTGLAPAGNAALWAAHISKRAIDMVSSFQVTR